MALIRRWIRNNSVKIGIAIFILTPIVNIVFDIPHLWGHIPLGWFITVLVFIVLNLHLFPIYWTKLWTRIKYGSLENYVCKGDYALPFTDKWCVFEGGFTKELSADWHELILRYAYFFAVVDGNGKGYAEDDSMLENYYSYGKNVLAVSDGVVVKVHNKYTDALFDKADEASNHTGTAALLGNHIVIRHQNEYTCVGNLMLNSATVKVGDRVKQGEVIAKCGNSGYMAESPCLYFLLQSNKRFNLSTSLPIAFSNITAEDSPAYAMAYKNEGVQRPSTKGNKRVTGKKTFIGRGLDVENSTRSCAAQTE